MKIFLAILMLTLATNSAWALDSTIRVMGVYFQGQASAQNAKTSLQGIKAGWEATNVGGTLPTSITLVNGGNAFPISAIPTGTNSEQFLDLIHLSSAINSLRNSNDADGV